jgi:hypothetical protein
MIGGTQRASGTTARSALHDNAGVPNMRPRTRTAGPSPSPKCRYAAAPCDPGPPTGRSHSVAT